MHVVGLRFYVPKYIIQIWNDNFSTISQKIYL